ncbi:MAG: DUF3791 domain-containing protein [Lachnospiraceae bacterium]|nr:DUF3791 domain-containing protein [Lachnospiraceae bacterium]
MCEERELDFSVFMIHSLAEAWGKLPAEVYQILHSSRILDEYIIPCYDVLHTQGVNSLVEDITEFVKERGGEI